MSEQKELQGDIIYEIGLYVAKKNLENLADTRKNVDLSETIPWISLITKATNAGEKERLIKNMMIQIAKDEEIEYYERQNLLLELDKLEKKNLVKYAEAAVEWGFLATNIVTQSPLKKLPTNSLTEFFIGDIQEVLKEEFNGRLNELADGMIVRNDHILKTDFEALGPSKVSHFGNSKTPIVEWYAGKELNIKKGDDKKHKEILDDIIKGSNTKKIERMKEDISKYFGEENKKFNHSFVLEGATMECSIGTEKCNLEIKRGIANKIVGRNKKENANIGHREKSNIKSFGRCKRHDSYPKCKPDIIIDWLLCEDSREISGKPVLTDNAIVPCLYGGVIDFVDNGQRKYPMMEEILRTGFELTNQE